MELKEITYFADEKKKKIKVKVCNTILSKMLGLMFRKNSSPLLFVFDRNRSLSIHSLFCKPFTAVWLDEKMRVTKITDVKNWRFNISGKGKYLLEIPELLQNDESSSTNRVFKNRNI